MARFGVTEAYVAEKLYTGLVDLYKVEHATKPSKDASSGSVHPQDSCKMI
jgi:hypothetical protein